MKTQNTLAVLCLLGASLVQGARLGQYTCCDQCYNPCTPCCEPIKTYVSQCAPQCYAPQCAPQCAPRCAPTRHYTKEIHHVRPQTTIVRAPPVSIAPPNVIVHINKDMCKPCCKPCCQPCCNPCCVPCREKIELSDEEEMAPIPLPELRAIGVEQEEFDELKNEFFNLRGDLTNMLSKIEQNQNIVTDNMNTIVSNLGTLEETIQGHDVRIERNTGDIKMLREELAKLRSELMILISRVGSEIKKVGNVDWSGALGSLEDQIEAAGGLNIGNRWRIRFKDDENKDFFIQDKSKKGYYRFRTTGCDNIVKGIKCNPCCCE